MCATHWLTLAHSYHHLIVAQLQSFRQNLESKVAIKENENRTILQKMQHAEQDLQVPLLLGKNVYANFKGRGSIGSSTKFLHCISLFIYK